MKSEKIKKAQSVERGGGGGGEKFTRVEALGDSWGTWRSRGPRCPVCRWPCRWPSSRTGPRLCRPQWRWRTPSVWSRPPPGSDQGPLQTQEGKKWLFIYGSILTTKDLRKHKFRQLLSIPNKTRFHQFDMVDSSKHYNTHKPQLQLPVWGTNQSLHQIQKALFLQIWTKHCVIAAKIIWNLCKTWKWIVLNCREFYQGSTVRDFSFHLSLMTHTTWFLAQWLDISEMLLGSLN